MERVCWITKALGHVFVYAMTVGPVSIARLRLARRIVVVTDIASVDDAIAVQVMCD